MLQNASNLSRRVRVLPPSTKFFSITLLSYPSDEGHLAPGMHATLHVRFAPDSLADYDDFLVVQARVHPLCLPAARGSRAWLAANVRLVPYCRPPTPLSCLPLISPRPRPSPRRQRRIRSRCRSMLAVRRRR